MQRSVTVVVGVFTVLVLAQGLAWGQDPADTPKLSEKEKRFVLGLGWAYVDFSTTFEQVRAGSGERIYVSLEGDLGLPVSQSVPFASLLARVGKKSYIAANVGRFRRSTDLFDLEETLHLEDLVVEVGADVDLFFNVTDVDVAYGHAYLDDERVRIIGKYGLSLFDLDLGLIAEGSYRIGDVSGSGRYEVSTSLLIPVPLVGVIFDVALSQGWVLTSSVELFYMPVSDITAEAWRARIHVRYDFSRTVSVNFGYGTLDIEVVEDTDEAKSTIAYQMNGFSAGLTFTF